MSPAYEEPSALARWLAESPRPSTVQYAGLVRRFLEREQVADLGAVQLAQLIAHVQSLTGTDARRKVATALSQFFAFLAKSGEIHGDPAIDLIETLSKEKKKKAIRDDLVAAGMADEDAASMTWRDVARAAFFTGRSSVPPDRMPPPQSEVMTQLTQRFLALIKSCSPEGVENLLGRPIDS